MNWLHRLLHGTPSPPQTTVERGAWAEQCALRHLRGQGLRELAHNYRCRGGELDLILRDGEILVFAEVRYRRGTAFGGALGSIGADKRRRISRCARYYLMQNPRYRHMACRFDVVLVAGERSAPEVQWLPDAWRE